jgi:hypothetical protein
MRQLIPRASLLERRRWYTSADRTPMIGRSTVSDEGHPCHVHDKAGARFIIQVPPALGNLRAIRYIRECQKVARWKGHHEGSRWYTQRASVSTPSRWESQGSGDGIPSVNKTRQVARRIDDGIPSVLQ